MDHGVKYRNRRLPLGEIAEVKAGPSGALLKELGDIPGGIPVVTPAEFSADHRIDPRSVRSIPDAKRARAAAYMLEPGDVLIVRQGALGRVALTDPGQVGWIYGSSCLRIRLSRTAQVFPEYLVAYLAQPDIMELLRGTALSGTVPSFNAEALRSLEVVVPSRRTQLRIVHTLEDMDAAISAKKAVVERMEALRPSVFTALLIEEEG